MRKDYLIGIVATLLAMCLFYFYDQASSQSPLKNSEEQNENSLEKIQAESAAGSQSASADVSQVPGPSSAEPAKPEDTQLVYKQFAEHLKTMGTCLEIKNSVDSDKVDPTFDNLVVSLRPALGEVVVQMDDWTQRDLKNSQGERKRIRTEVSYQEAGISSPTKRVQLYKLNQQGMPELQTIDPEQSVNPSDAFVESLIGDSQTTLEEKGGRAYYQEGEEIIMIERNGKLESISLTKGGKTVSCSGLDSVTSSCQCL